MRAVAAVVSAWAVLRWTSVALGLWRSRRFEGPVRREAARACVARASVNVFLSAGAILAWVQALGLKPRSEIVGFGAMLLMIALVAGVLAAFMQPKERTSETLDIFRIGRTITMKP